MSKEQKVVKISENKLVELIDNILNEAVEVKKKEWIAEQAKTDKTAILESKLADLEKKISAITSKYSCSSFVIILSDNITLHK